MFLFVFFLFEVAILDSGFKGINVEEELKFGVMVQFMKVTGVMTWRVVVVD